jgi:glutamate-ammonia-ligase adenylyltransferase
VSESVSLAQVARAGFTDLEAGRASSEHVATLAGITVEDALQIFASSADPSRAGTEFARLYDLDSSSVTSLARDPEALRRLLLVLGGSRGLAEFLQRHPASLHVLAEPLTSLPTQEEARKFLCAAVQAKQGFAAMTGDTGKDALRVRYREQLVAVAAYDLGSAEPVVVVDAVAAALADLAGGAIEASLAVARGDLVGDFTREEIDLVELSVIGMGKCGARELNYLSDVDVIYVGQSRDQDALPTERALLIATRLAQGIMRGIFEVSREPGLWELDANLRPEGKDGALVRTLDSHLAYYDRWAKNWEFQALLKARPLAGSVALGEAYMSGVAPKVWSSASRPGFVDQVQRMRERVTDNIPAADLDWQLKLGPGGLRDIEFTVQLLQLVHGQSDESVRLRGTIESLDALNQAGFVGRAEAASFAENYRLLRVLEHRIQLRDLSRTHLMPRDEEGQRVLARASGLASTDSALMERWAEIKRTVRQLHERLFYRPLLSAVANLPEGGHQLSPEQAQDRLAAIGFKDAKGALGHIAALTAGLSRRATIQKALLPVLLEWFANGADPDNGLLAFRRLSEALGESHWYLRMLRDSAAAAERLTQILSGSRFVTDLLERIPEGVAWLEDDEELKPRDLEALDAEARALLSRHEDSESAVAAIRFMRRREVLRLAIAGITSVRSMAELSQGLTDITTASLRAFLDLAQRGDDANVDFGIIAMGRYGGAELGFGSDADVLFVYRAIDEDSEAARRRAESISGKMSQFVADARLALELDLDLRPEGKNGPNVRSLDSYQAYYDRWALTWEAQALLRAAPVAGNERLLEDFMTMVDDVRYSAEVSETELREIRRIKARVESERLPQGADPTRHLKLGRGSLSDVEWTVQLLQLEYGASIPALRTPSTLAGIHAARDAKLLTAVDAQRLEDAWVLASRVRSAMTLWAQRSSDVLPTDIRDLDGIARLLGYPRGGASALEDSYLSVTRKARGVVERVFYEIEPKKR